MSHIRFGEGEVEERVSKIEQYLTELQLHKDSRRGTEGARGEQGLPGRDGVGVVGPQGPPADITHVIEAALKRVREEFDAEYKILQEVVRHELKTSGVIDESGNAVLIPGPTGAPGASVVGAKGDSGQDGVSVIGPRGRDAKIAIGSVTVGSEASASLREHENGQVLDLVLPRGERGETGAAGQDGVSNVPGPAGERGPEGERGIPGPGMSKDAIISLVMDLKRRGTI